jgi:hypothetical protein
MLLQCGRQERSYEDVVTELFPTIPDFPRLPLPMAPHDSPAAVSVPRQRTRRQSSFTKVQRGIPPRSRPFPNRGFAPVQKRSRSEGRDDEPPPPIGLRIAPLPYLSHLRLHRISPALPISRFFGRTVTLLQLHADARNRRPSASAVTSACPALSPLRAAPSATPGPAGPDHGGAEASPFPLGRSEPGRHSRPITASRRPIRLLTAERNL